MGLHFVDNDSVGPIVELAVECYMFYVQAPASVKQVGFSVLSMVGASTGDTPGLPESAPVIGH